MVRKQYGKKKQQQPCDLNTRFSFHHLQFTAQTRTTNLLSFKKWFYLKLFYIFLYLQLYLSLLKLFLYSNSTHAHVTHRLKHILEPILGSHERLPPSKTCLKTMKTTTFQTATKMSSASFKLFVRGCFSRRAFPTGVEVEGLTS